MHIFQFIFSFLYTRNWHTGEKELSTPKLALFSAMMFLLLLGVVIASVLQSPISYIQ